MAATLTRLIFFASGDLHAIVNADHDNELAPHTGPMGAVFVDVPRVAYLACSNTRDHLALALPAVAQKDPALAGLVTAKIQTLDDAAAAVAASQAANIAAAASAGGIIG